LTADHFEDVTHQARFHELHKEASWTWESYQKSHDERERRSDAFGELRARIASASNKISKQGSMQLIIGGVQHHAGGVGELATADTVNMLQHASPVQRKLTWS
jgi:hypothetical protein